jgi:N-terminal domain of anti-restriction factor ArdC
MDKQNLALESLARIQSGDSLSNYPVIFAGFQSKGIPLNDIKPRENVFTYNAWKALNRQVRKGESGVKVITWIPCKDKDTENSRMLCKHSTVFHISQTDPIQ